MKTCPLGNVGLSRRTRRGSLVVGALVRPRLLVFFCVARGGLRRRSAARRRSTRRRPALSPLFFFAFPGRLAGPGAFGPRLEGASSFLRRSDVAFSCQEARLSAMGGGGGGPGGGGGGRQGAALFRGWAGHANSFLQELLMKEVATKTCLLPFLFSSLRVFFSSGHPDRGLGGGAPRGEALDARVPGSLPDAFFDPFAPDLSGRRPRPPGELALADAAGSSVVR